MYRDDLLRQTAAASGISNKKLEKLTGLSRPTVIRIMNGDKSGRFELHRLYTIAQTLGIPMRQLFEERAPVVEQADVLPSVSGSV